MWVQYLGCKDPMEKEMATHSSMLAWRISWKRSLVGYSPWDHKYLDLHLIKSHVISMFSFLEILTLIT